MKKILGLDLGTTSIGWAHINEDENLENSSINKIGTRIIQYDTFSKVDKLGNVSESKDPIADFNAGRGLSPNADRTKMRGARRSLQRFKLRRRNLLKLLKDNDIINDDFKYAEDLDHSTFSSYKLRNDAVIKEITLAEFAQILLMLNKKRGYKSSRKAKTEDEGNVIDGMGIAKILYEKNVTPGQFVYNQLKEGKKGIPDFYQSDLKLEFDKVWNFQKQFYADILTEDFKKQVEGKGLKATTALFLAKYQIYTAENKTNDKTLQKYQWRNDATNVKLEKEVLAFVIAEINNNLNNSSGYLGAISDRSKELYFKKITVGQYLYTQVVENPHVRLKNQVFYRQDYFDEFEKIWETQAKFHKILNDKLKNEIRDIVIFYQRKLKSQKHLISNCEFEKKHKVVPKSSLLFQEFKIWQVLNNLEITNLKTKEKEFFDIETKRFLFNELNIKGKKTNKEVIELLGYQEKDYNLNFKEIEGNNTNKELFLAYKKILVNEGYDLDLTKPAIEIKNIVKSIFNDININTSILEFDGEIDGNLFDKQLSYQLWHCLYSLEEDYLIIDTLKKKFNFKEDHAKILANVALQPDYGSLSAKAIKKVMPFLKAGNRYDEACVFAKYSNKGSLTKEELENRILKDKLEELPKNSLRNPVVEKILNQMINVVNAILIDPELGRPEEVRVELARELKKSNDERARMTESINAATKEHEKYRKEIQAAPFNIKYPTRNDIIKYKLYLELETNGFKTLYSNTYIAPELLFSGNFDIEHIIPKAKLFDDSFSNKTLEKREVNLKKKDATAFDFVANEYHLNLVDYKANVDKLIKNKIISKAKYSKLLMKGSEIPDGFIDRDLRDTQYIAKKAKQILEQVFRRVTTTTGSVTDRLREDWGLVNIMQELNFEKYKAVGLTEKVEKKDGSFKEKITDWNKRNDHRHHAMDALTIAFTKPAYIQYLNNLNAKKQESEKGKEIIGIEAKYLEKVYTENGSKKVFKAPMVHFRSKAKEQLEQLLISFKAKSKVVTKNINKIKLKGKNNYIYIEQPTPRGQLHKETIYGKINVIKNSDEKIDGKMTFEKINTVCNPLFKELLLSRLIANNNDPKKAFTGKNSLDKTPIFINQNKTITIPPKIKTSYLETEYTIKKDITPENFKDQKSLEKIIDIGIKRILENRLAQYGNDPKKAFVDLDKDPIWLNQEKGIAIKKVTISGIKNAVALHNKKDHFGNEILDKDGKTQPVDFVSEGNNHHVAIYEDSEGNLQEEVVSLYEAVTRANQGLPVVNKNHKQGWKFLFTMKRNECFVFPDENFNHKEIDLMDPKNAKLISKRLFRVQKIATKNYMFRHHLETNVNIIDKLNNVTFKHIQSCNLLKNIVKVRINHLGKIVQIGE